MGQMIELNRALKLDTKTRLAVVGAGGKTSLVFRAAREYAAPIVITTTTHISADQARLADNHFIVSEIKELDQIFARKLTCALLLTGGPVEEHRLTGLSTELIEHLFELADRFDLPVLIEADGSRMHPLKAPADHEPAIPAWVNHVAVIAGLSGIGEPLNKDLVHRPEIFSALSGGEPGKPVGWEDVVKVLLSTQGGLKNIPTQAVKSVILNQADNETLQAMAGSMARQLLAGFDEVIISQLNDAQQPIKAVYRSIAGIILAGGRSDRMGASKKAILDWQGETFVHKAARTALETGLDPVIVISGAYPEEIRQALVDLPIQIAHNSDWEKGQSSSIQTGIRSLPSKTGGAIFLLVDQPQVECSILKALVELHRTTLASAIIPQVEGRRANPVLFDAATFNDLLQLQGDVGGRAIFSKYPVEWLPWNDPLLLLDVDTPEDYRRLQDAYAAKFTD